MNLPIIETVVESVYNAQMIASIAVCAAGAIAMYVSKGETGIGWAIFGLFIIWS